MVNSFSLSVRVTQAQSLVRLSCCQLCLFPANLTAKFIRMLELGHVLNFDPVVIVTRQLNTTVRVNDQCSMAFFNLTHTGPQDPFKTASSVVSEEVPSERKTEKHETHGEVGEGQKEREGSDLKQNSPSAIPSPTAAAPTSWHRGSHTKYTELLRKHQRTPKGV